jgi:hypothetical protein
LGSTGLRDELTTLARPAAVESRELHMMVEMEIEDAVARIAWTPPQLSGELRIMLLLEKNGERGLPI